MANPKKAAVKADAKPAKAAKKAAAPIAKAPPAPKAAAKVAAEAAVEVVKIKELVEAVAEKTSRKKPETKALVEAVLTELGLALERGAELNLPYLGRVKIVKSVDKTQGVQLTAKIKRISAKPTENKS